MSDLAIMTANADEILSAIPDVTNEALTAYREAVAAALLADNKHAYGMVASAVINLRNAIPGVVNKAVKTLEDHFLMEHLSLQMTA